MDPYSANVNAQIQPERPHGVGADFEEEEHHEKKSSMKRMKDKVKKIRNTISEKVHAYGHSHEEHTSSEKGEEEEEEEEEDDETEADPEVRGASMDESAAAEKFVTGPTSHHENRGPGSVSPVTSIGRAEEDPARPNSSTRTSAPSDQTQLISSSSTGSDMVGESPIRNSFQNMVVSDEGQCEKEALKSPPTGTHDNKFFPENPPCLTEDKLKEWSQVDEKEKEALKSPPTGTYSNKFSPENPPCLTEDKPNDPSKPTDIHDNQFPPENPPYITEDKLKEPSQVGEKEKEAFMSPPTAPHGNQFSLENPPRLTKDKPKEPIQVDEKEKESLKSPPTNPHDSHFSPKNPSCLMEDKSKEPSQVDEKEKEALKSPPTVTHDNKFSPEILPHLTEEKPKEPSQIDEKEEALHVKKHEAVESHTVVAEAEAEAEGGGGIGVVGKFKGMVTSFLGMGYDTAPVAADEQVRGPGQEVGSQVLEDKDIKQ